MPTGVLVLAGATLADADHDPRNALAGSPALLASGSGLVEVPTVLERGSSLTVGDDGDRLALPGLVQSSAPGELDGVGLDVEGGGEIDLPFAVTSLHDGSIVRYTDGSVVDTSTGRSALRTLTQFGEDSALTMDQPLAVNHALTVRDSELLDDAELHVPSVTLRGDTFFGIESRKGVATLFGNVTAPDPDTAVTIDLRGAVIGSFAQGDATTVLSDKRDVRPAAVTGNWTVGPDARTTIPLNGILTSPNYTRMNVGGAAHLDGTVTIKAPAQTSPPLGAVEHVITAAGGLTGTFTNLPQGAVVSGFTVHYAATSLDLTCTG